MKALKFLPVAGALVLLAGCNGWGGSSTTYTPRPSHSGHYNAPAVCTVTMKSMRHNSVVSKHGLSMSRANNFCSRYKSRHGHNGFCRVSCVR